MKPLIVGLALLVLATAAQADVGIENHDGGAKASEGAGAADPGNDSNHDGIDDSRYGTWERMSPNDPRYASTHDEYGRRLDSDLGLDMNGNPSEDVPGSGPDWDPMRDAPYEGADDDSIDWGW